jgi:hypothetical protein
MDELANHFIEDEPRRHIGDVAGVEVAITRGWWVQPLGMLLAGQLLGRLFGKPDHRLRRGLGYTGAIAAAGIGALILSLAIRNRYLRFFGLASTFIGLGALIPVAGNDGENLFLHKHD